MTDEPVLAPRPSTVVLAATLLLWARSHLSADWLRYGRAFGAGPGRVCYYRGEIVTRGGSIMVGTSRRVYEDHDHVRRVLADQGGLRWDVFIAEPASPLRSIVPPGPPGFWKRLGFDYKRLGAKRATYAIGNPAVVSAGTDYDGATVEAPAWSLALLASVPLALRAARHVRGRRRSRAGRCRQ